MGEKVFIIDVNKHSKTINIDMGETLATLKAMYLEKFGVDLNNYRLTFGGKNLDDGKDDQTLTSLGIKNGTRIVTVLRAMGGN